MRILLYGFGTVGQGIYRIAQERKAQLEAALGESISFAGIVVRNPKKKRDISVPPSLFTADGDALLQEDSVDTIVEVTSDKQNSIAVIRRALSLGKNVVTANKAAVAADFPTLLRLAWEHQVAFRYEACVGGGIPILDPLLQQRVCNEILQLRGIVNGSSNYVLSERMKGRSEKPVLAEARAKGVLEEDPTDDLEGYDAQRKLVILATLASGKKVDVAAVPCIGIHPLESTDFAFAKATHRVIKLIASYSFTRQGAQLAVRPVALLPEDSLALVSGIFNQVELQGDEVGALRFYGLGGGEKATANAVWTDLLRLRHTSDVSLLPQDIIPLDEKARSLFYVRFPDCVTVKKYQALIGEHVNGAADLEPMAKLPENAIFCSLSMREAEDIAKEGAVVVEWSLS